MFVNFSNHPSEKWEREQTEVAHIYGEIVDVPFPIVPAAMDEDGVAVLATECYDRIMSHAPSAVMCQGEFTLTYLVVRKLQEAGVRVVSACSERNVIEKDGEKISRFQFVRFRTYH